MSDASMVECPMNAWQLRLVYRRVLVLSESGPRSGNTGQSRARHHALSIHHSHDDHMVVPARILHNHVSGYQAQGNDGGSQYNHRDMDGKQPRRSCRRVSVIGKLT